MQTGAEERSLKSPHCTRSYANELVAVFSVFVKVKLITAEKADLRGRGSQVEVKAAKSYRMHSRFSQTMYECK